MTKDRTELVQRGYVAWNSGDRSWVLEHMTDDVVWVTPPEDPDASVYRGYPGVQRYWDEWKEEIDDLRLEPLRFIAAGDDVLVVVRRIGHGRSSGVEVSDEVVQVFCFEDDRCYRVREFYDLKRAMDSVAAQPEHG